MIRFNLVKKRFETYKLKFVLSSEYVYYSLSLHSVDRPPPFSAMPDVGTYRLGASVARIAPAVK